MKSYVMVRWKWCINPLTSSKGAQQTCQLSVTEFRRLGTSSLATWPVKVPHWGCSESRDRKRAIIQAPARTLSLPPTQKILGIGDGQAREGWASWQEAGSWEVHGCQESRNLLRLTNKLAGVRWPPGLHQNPQNWYFHLVVIFWELFLWKKHIC